MVLEDNEGDSVFETQITEEHVETHYGNVHCIMTGTPKANLPVLLTFHDVGLNHKSCFDPLFIHEDMQEIIRHLPVCHIEAPGQHEGAKTLHDEYSYPSMDQLSEAVPAVLKHFGLCRVIGLGVGAGAYILAKFALNHPDMVDGLVLININASAEGLMGSVASKLTGWTHTLPETVIPHLFGKDEIDTNHDLIATYRHHITTTMNQANVSQFLRSYHSRNALEVERPVPGGSINVRTLKCSTLLIVGDNSPAVEAVVDCNSKLDPTKTTLLKMADCGGLPQVDQPAKVIEALKYFIQGMGYLSSASMTRLRSRTASGSSVSSFDGSRSRAHTNELQRARTHSRGAEEKRGRSHTDSMECSSNSDQIASKSNQVAC
ncbi:protein NDRG1 isoform X1 [Gasterosteus aculeatus]|uniref:protein NDRG1-like n=1 Tax=Gasterosteus aculeatus aculeatus TaxID=481459 RepID=UPI001A99879E|nr:protein NDRG1-like [Gasterosteus aculeatus aculeatus]